jgi:hypothetical protein
MIIQTLCDIFKLNLLKGLENFNTGTSYVYKIALYAAEADLGADTTTYTTLNEVVGSGYTAGGKILTPTVPTSNGSTAFISFSNVTWDPASFSTQGALIYNSSTGAAVTVLNFGAVKEATTTFSVIFPAATNNSAIIRIS